MPADIFSSNKSPVKKDINPGASVANIFAQNKPSVIVNSTLDITPADLMSPFQPAPRLDSDLLKDAAYTTAILEEQKKSQQMADNIKASQQNLDNLKYYGIEVPKPGTTDKVTLAEVGLQNAADDIITKRNDIMQANPLAVYNPKPQSNKPVDAAQLAAEHRRPVTVNISKGSLAQDNLDRKSMSDYGKAIDDYKTKQWDYTHKVLPEAQKEQEEELNWILNATDDDYENRYHVNQYSQEAELATNAYEEANQAYLNALANPLLDTSRDDVDHNSKLYIAAQQQAEAAKQARNEAYKAQQEAIAQRDSASNQVVQQRMTALYIKAVEDDSSLQNLFDKYAEMYIDLNNTPTSEWTSAQNKKYKLNSEGIVVDAKTGLSADAIKADIARQLKEKGVSEKDRNTLFETWNRQANALTAENRMRDIQSLFNTGSTAKDIGNSTWATVLSFGTNFLGGFASLGETIAQKARNTYYTNLDANADGYYLTNLTQDIRGGVGERFNTTKLYGTKFDWFGAAYGILTSTADSLLAAYAGGAVGSALGVTGETTGLLGKVPGAIGGASIGLQAATSTMLDLTRQGADARQAIAGGLVAGIFESLFESWSISKFQALQEVGKAGVAAAFLKGNKQGIKAVARELGVQFLTNGSEEFFTEIANVVYDTLVNDGLSGYSQHMQEYLAENAGATEEQARQYAMRKLVIQCLEAGATGAVQGLLMGGLGLAGSKRLADAVKEYRDLSRKNSDISSHINTAHYAFDKDSEAYKIANKLVEDANSFKERIAGMSSEDIIEERRKFEKEHEETFDKLRDAIASNEGRTKFEDAEESAENESAVATATTTKAQAVDATEYHQDTQETQVMQSLVSNGLTAGEAQTVAKIMFRVVSGDTTLSANQVKKGLGSLIVNEGMLKTFTELTGKEVPVKKATAIAQLLRETAAEIAATREESGRAVFQEAVQQGENSRQLAMAQADVNAMIEQTQEAFDDATADSSDASDSIPQLDAEHTYVNGEIVSKEDIAEFVREQLGNQTTDAAIDEFWNTLKQAAESNESVDYGEVIEDVKRSIAMQTPMINSKLGTTEDGVMPGQKYAAAMLQSEFAPLGVKGVNLVATDNNGNYVDVETGEVIDIADARGMYDPKNHMIYLNADAIDNASLDRTSILGATINGMRWVASHEFMHSAIASEETADGKKKRMSEVIDAGKNLVQKGIFIGETAKYLKDEETYKAQMDSVIDLYKDYYVNHNQQEKADAFNDLDAMEEISGDVLADILSNANALQAFAYIQPGTLKKFRAWIASKNLESKAKLLSKNGYLDEAIGLADAARKAKINPTAEKLLSSIDKALRYAEPALDDAEAVQESYNRHSLNIATVNYAKEFTGLSEQSEATYNAIKELGVIQQSLNRILRDKTVTEAGHSRANIHNINEYLAKHQDLWQQLIDIQAAANKAGVPVDFVTPIQDGQIVEGKKVAAGLKGYAIEYVEKDGGEYKFGGFARSLPQMFIDSMAPDARWKFQNELIAAVEDAYQKKKTVAHPAPELARMLKAVAGDTSSSAIAGKTKHYIQTALRSAKKTVMALNLNAACPMFTIGNHGCYLDACYLTQMGAGGNAVNLFKSALYTGEILQLSDETVRMLNADPDGLRVNGVGDTISENKGALFAAFRHAAMRGLKLKIITKQAATLALVQEAHDLGIDTSRITVQMSLDNLWIPAEMDDAWGAGVRGTIGIADTLKRGSEEALEAASEAYNDMFGRAAKIMDGKLYRKYGFTAEQIKELKARYPDVFVVPRYVVTTAEEMCELALGHGGLDDTMFIQTLMHGKVPAACISDYGGNVLNFGSARHAFAEDENGKITEFYGAKVSKAKGSSEVTITKINSKAHAEVDAFIKNNYTEEEQQKIYQTLKRQICCKASGELDACAGCQSACAGGGCGLASAIRSSKGLKLEAADDMRDAVVPYSGLRNHIPTSSEVMDDGVKYSIEDRPNVVANLEEQIKRGEYDPVSNPNGGYIVTYRTCWQGPDGALYSPMAGKIFENGEWKYGTSFDEDGWYRTDYPSDIEALIENGKLTYKGDGYNNGDLDSEDHTPWDFLLKKPELNKDVPAAFNPYMHSSPGMLNDQFSVAYERDGLVVVKCLVPVSEVDITKAVDPESGEYRNEPFRYETKTTRDVYASYSGKAKNADGTLAKGKQLIPAGTVIKAKNSVGKANWKAGPVTGKVGGGRDVYVTRWIKHAGIVSDAEAAKSIAQWFKEHDYTDGVYANVVTPTLRQALENEGVKILSPQKKMADGYYEEMKKLGMTREQAEGKEKLPPDFFAREKQSNVKHSIPTDTEYFKLAENPEKNATELRKAVEAAAKAKGAETDKNGNVIYLYHGTSVSGFTRLDMEQGKGSRAFWTTNSQKQAGTFTSKDAKTTIADMKKSTDITEARSKFNDGLSTLREMVDLWNYGDDSAGKVFVEKCKAIFEKAAKNRGTNNDAIYYEFTDLASKMRQEIDNEFLGEEDAKEWYNAMNQMRKTLDSILKSEQYGLYSLFMRPNQKMYEIDAGGRFYENVHFTDQNLIDALGSDVAAARDITEAVRKLGGYDGLLIKNVKDNGEAGDFYIFFNEDSVWSADPVTYDDEGNPIPISKRFTDNKDIRHSIRGASLYSGGGAVDYAVKEYVKHLAGVELEDKYAAFWKTNLGDAVIVSDILSPNLDKELASRLKAVEYVHASPPCVGSSKMNNKRTEQNWRHNQTDIKLAEATVQKLALAENNKVFTLENVPEYEQTDAFKIITDGLAELGYKFNFGTLNSADFGSATARERLLLQAVKEDMVLPAIPKGFLSKESGNWQTWGEVAGNMIDSLPVLTAEEVNDRMVDSLRSYDNIDVFDVDRPLLVFGESYANKKFGHAYIDETVPTIIKKSGASRLFLPGGEVREVTPEFLGRIMGFGDDYSFEGKRNKTAGRAIVGNGVPIDLTKALTLPLLAANFDDADVQRAYKDLQQKQAALSQQSDDTENDVKYSIAGLNEEHPEVTHALNFRDPSGELIQRVFDGTKKYETRKWNNKRGNGKIPGAYLNKLMGVARTGAGQATLEGYWKLGSAMLKDGQEIINNPKLLSEIANDGTNYAIDPNEKYWLYRILETEKVNARPIEDRGNPRTKNIEGTYETNDYSDYLHDIGMFADSLSGFDSWNELDYVGGEFANYVSRRVESVIDSVLNGNLSVDEIESSLKQIETDALKQAESIRQETNAEVSDAMLKYYADEFSGYFSSLAEELSNRIAVDDNAKLSLSADQKKTVNDFLSLIAKETKSANGAEALQKLANNAGSDKNAKLARILAKNNAPLVNELARKNKMIANRDLQLAVQDAESYMKLRDTKKEAKAKLDELKSALENSHREYVKVERNRDILRERLHNQDIALVRAAARNAMSDGKSKAEKIDKLNARISDISRKRRASFKYATKQLATSSGKINDVHTQRVAAPINTLTNLEKSEKDKPSFAERAKNIATKLHRGFVNEARAIDLYSRLTQERDAVRTSSLVNIVHGAGATVRAVLTSGLVGKEGLALKKADGTDFDSLRNVALCLDESGNIIWEEQNILQDYLLHRHNIDRMSYVARAVAYLDELTKAHPWLQQLTSEDIARYYSNTSKETAKTQTDERERIVRDYVSRLQAVNSAENKPIFYVDKNGKMVSADTLDAKPVSAQDSQAMVSSYESQYSWLKDKADGINEWWDAFMREWAVGVNISEDTYNLWKSLYPHYVPTFREGKATGGSGTAGSKNEAQIGNVFKAATGGSSQVQNIADSLAALADRIIHQNRSNELFMSVIDSALADDMSQDGPKGGNYAIFDWEAFDKANSDYADTMRLLAMLNGVDLSEMDKSRQAALEKLGDGTWRVTGYVNGERLSARVSEDMYRALAGTASQLTDKFTKLTALGNKLTSPMKTMITGINPFFALRNVVRDIPTAIINGNMGFAVGKYWVRACAEMSNKTDNWKTFVALGGTGTGYHSESSGFSKQMMRKEKASAKVVEKLGKFNEVTEAATRFAEYLAYLDKYEKRNGEINYAAKVNAIKAAAEVTVDFSRHGEYGKLINAWIPYWNPAVQGIDKMYRSVFDNEGTLKEKFKAAGVTLSRAAILSLAPEVFFQMLYKALGRDKDWEQLSDRTKDTYYCVPLAEHKFLKVPKNREWAAILGTPLMRILEGLDGRADCFENYVEDALIANFIPGGVEDAIGIGTMFDLATNEDFAGRAIVPYSLQGAEKRYQYDADTSAAAFLLSEGWNHTIGAIATELLSGNDKAQWSPMQVDYILSSFCGDFYDKIFDMFPKGLFDSDYNFADVLSEVGSSIGTSFVSDNRYSNFYVGEYYTILNKLSKDKKNPDSKVVERAEKIYETVNGNHAKKLKELKEKYNNTSDKDKKDKIKWQIAIECQKGVEEYRKLTDKE